MFGQYLSKLTTVHTFDIVVLNCRDALYFDHCTVAWIDPIDANSIFQLIYDICHIFTKEASIYYVILCYRCILIKLFWVTENVLTTNKSSTQDVFLLMGYLTKI